MSLILDALRGRSPDREGNGEPKTARADTVLATLGYSKRQGRIGPSLKTLDALWSRRDPRRVRWIGVTHHPARAVDAAESGRARAATGGAPNSRPRPRARRARVHCRQRRPRTLRALGRLPHSQRRGLGPGCRSRSPRGRGARNSSCRPRYPLAPRPAGHSRRRQPQNQRRRKSRGRSRRPLPRHHPLRRVPRRPPRRVRRPPCLRGPYRPPRRGRPRPSRRTRRRPKPRRSRLLSITSASRCITNAPETSTTR